MLQLTKERLAAKTKDPRCPRCGSGLDFYQCPAHGKTAIDCSRCCWILVECCCDEGCALCAAGGACQP